VKTPFVQADSMDRVVSLLENLYEKFVEKFFKKRKKPKQRISGT